KRLKVRQLRVARVEVFDIAAERVPEFRQEQLHGFVGEIRGGKQLGRRTKALQKLHEGPSDARAAVGRRHIDHLDHAVAVEGVRQDAVPDGPALPLGDEALTGVHPGADVRHPPRVALRHLVKGNEGVDVVWPRGPDMDRHGCSLQCGSRSVQGKTSPCLATWSASHEKAAERTYVSSMVDTSV